MISFIAAWMKPIPTEAESALSTMGRALYGGSNPMYFILQFATMAILILAANTAYADFPRLAAIIGRDGFLPRQFANRGDRLVFSNGVLILAGAASILLIAFQGSVTLLIPLYAVGVFTSFTISQTGMVRHHMKERQKGWKLSVVNSTLGAIATFIVAAVVIVSKFAIGAWIIVVLIPCIVFAFRGVKKHYNGVAKKLRVDPSHREDIRPPGHGVVVLVGGVNQSSLAAIRYARSVGATDAVAVTVALDEEHAERIREAWLRYDIQFPLEIIESPYRDLTNTVEDYLDELDSRWGHDYVTVVIPRVRPAPLVAGHLPQPVGPGPEAGAQVPQGHRGGQRAVPPRRGRGPPRHVGGVPGPARAPRRPAADRGPGGAGGGRRVRRRRRGPDPGPAGRPRLTIRRFPGNRR